MQMADRYVAEMPDDHELLADDDDETTVSDDDGMERPVNLTKYGRQYGQDQIYLLLIG